MNKVVHDLRDYYDKVFNSQKWDKEIRIMAWKCREILKACIATYENNYELCEHDIDDLKILYSTRFRPAFKEEIQELVQNIKKERGW